MRVMAVLVVVAGCGATRPNVPTPAEQALAARLDELAYRGGLSASVAGVTLWRLDSGAVRIVWAGAEQAGDGELPPLGRAGARRDLRIEAQVRGAASTDPLLAGVDLDIDVDSGLVRIMGDLATAEQAARVVEIALHTPGVVAVESRCAWLLRAH